MEIRNRDLEHGWEYLVTNNICVVIHQNASSIIRSHLMGIGGELRSGFLTLTLEKAVK
jgi:hypothetical protein